MLKLFYVVARPLKSSLSVMILLMTLTLKIFCYQYISFHQLLLEIMEPSM